MTSDPVDQATFSIEGIMVASHPGQVRLLVDQLLIDLEESDVASVTELPLPDGLDARMALPVRLELRRGARLLGAGSAAAYEDVIWGRGQLFAIRTRRDELPWQIGESYRQLARTFFARYESARDGEPETAP